MHYATPQVDSTWEYSRGGVYRVVSSDRGVLKVRHIQGPAGWRPGESYWRLSNLYGTGGLVGIYYLRGQCLPTGLVEWYDCFRPAISPRVNPLVHP